jgi:hypothetical protein
MTNLRTNLILGYSPMIPIRHFVLAVCVTVAGLPAAFGQPVGYPSAPPPPPVTQPPPQTSLSSGLSLPSSAALHTGPSTYPPAVYNPYGYPSYQGAVGGALSGAADVVNAQGQYLVQQQQSRMLQTQADSSRIGYRQQLLQEQRYEQSITPTVQEIRERQAWSQLQTARNSPTLPDIWSGSALNSLLVALQGAEVQGLKADPVPITTDVMTHMNFTTGTSSGAGAGMLKEFNNLQWPFALQLPPFQDGQTKIDSLAKTAIGEIKNDGRVTAATFTALNTAVNTLNTAANANQTLSASDWITSTTFLGQLQSSVQSLRNPDVAQYFNGQLTPQAGTVSELVQQMTAKGLRFAPAAQGDQPAYTTMQQLLRTYDYHLAQLASR